MLPLTGRSMPSTTPTPTWPNRRALRSRHRSRARPALVSVGVAQRRQELAEVALAAEDARAAWHAGRCRAGGRAHHSAIVDGASRRAGIDAGRRGLYPRQMNQFEGSIMKIIRSEKSPALGLATLAVAVAAVAAGILAGAGNA